MSWHSLGVVSWRWLGRSWWINRRFIPFFKTWRAQGVVRIGPLEVKR